MSKVLKILIEKCEDCPYCRCDEDSVSYLKSFCDYKNIHRELKDFEIETIPEKCPLMLTKEAEENTKNAYEIDGGKK